MGSNSLRQLDYTAHRRCYDNKINILKTTVKTNDIIIYQTKLKGFLQPRRITPKSGNALRKFFIPHNLRQRPANKSQSDNRYVIEKHGAV
jgi:hypothetical protein